jgi:WD40 repeat protein
VGNDRVWALTRDARGLAVGLRLWNFAENRDEVTVPLAVPEASSWLFLPFPVMRDDGGACLVSIRTLSETNAAWRLQVYDLGARRVAHELKPDTRITALALSPDGALLAAALADAGTISIFDLRTNKLHWQQPGGMSIIETLAFSPDGTRLLAGGATSTIRMFAVSDGRTLGDFHGHDVGILAICWAADNHVFFAADSGGDLRRWEATPPTVRHTRIRTGYSVESWADMVAKRGISVSDDGARFAASDSDHTFRIASVHAATEAEESLAGAFPLAFDADATQFAAMSEAGVLNTYSIGPGPTRATEHALLPAGTRVNCAALSTNRKVLIAGSPTGEVWFWKYPSRELIAERHAGQSVLWAVVSPAGDVVVANGRDNIVRVWSTARGELLGEFSTGGARRAAFSAAVSPDGRSLALCLETGELEVRPLDRLDAARRLRTDSARLYGIAYSPDGGRLYCGGSNGVVHGYATDDWRLVVTLGSPTPSQGTDSTVTSLAVSAAANTLLAYRADGTVRIWDTGGTR